MSERSERIRRELLALQRPDEKIYPVDAVRWARRNRSSALHAELEWDDKTAGDLYRQDQVRQLIILNIIDTGGHRQLVSLSIDRVTGGGYRQMESVMKNASLRDIMLRDALGDLERLQHRYRALQELAGVWEAAEGVKKTAGRPRKKAA